MNGRELRGRLGEGDIGSEAADAVEGGFTAIGKGLCAIAAERREDVGAVEVAAGFERCENADDGVGPVVKLDRAPGQRLAAAHAPPVGVGDDGLVKAVCFVAGLGEVGAQGERRPQGAEEVFGDEQAVGMTDAGGGLDAGRPAGVRGHGLEGAAAVLPIHQGWNGE